MRAFLHDLLHTDIELQTYLGLTPEELQARVMPRRAERTIDIPKPFLIYGLGNASNMDLSDSTANEPNDAEAERQYFQVWIHDEGGDFSVIDDIVEIVKRRLRGAQSTAHGIYTIEYLETSQEFNNETYNTNFRYIRFQAIKVKVGAPA